MIPKTLNFCFFVLLIALIITSCKKDVSPEESVIGRGEISYFAKASGTSIKAEASKSNRVLDNSVPVEWSSAYIFVEKISFVGKSGNFLDTTISVEKNMNIFSADALAGVLELPAGSYKDVKVKLYLKKSPKSELAFLLKGTFINTKGGRDSVILASSYPFEADLTTADITLNPSDDYKITFNFNLDKVLAGISAELLQTAKSHTGLDNKKIYSIWKGGSDDEPLYDRVTENWQTVASVLVSK